MNDENTRTYKITLRSTVDVEVEVAADSIEEARAKAFEWYDDSEGVGEFNGYWIGETHVDEEFTLWWNISNFDNEIVIVKEVIGVEEE